MKIAEIKFAPWDKGYYFDPANIKLKAGDFVIVENGSNSDIGKVEAIKELSKEELENEYKKNKADEEIENEDKEKLYEIKPITRKATSSDLAKIPSLKDKKKALEVCKDLISKYELPMKLVDVHFSFDDSKLTFAFIADGRVDFRELVKELTRHFNRTIRLHQIGIRDEAKIKGDCGHCGRKLCCKGHLKNLASITSEMAETQQLVHRGSERLSGVCGRLMCCLAYEQCGYECLAKKMPPIGAKVVVDGKKGEVVNQHVLKQAVTVKFPAEKGEGESFVEVDLNRNKK